MRDRNNARNNNCHADDELIESEIFEYVTLRNGGAAVYRETALYVIERVYLIEEVCLVRGYSTKRRI